MYAKSAILFQNPYKRDYRYRSISRRYTRHIKRKIAEKLNPSSSGTAAAFTPTEDEFANGFRIIYLGEQVNEARTHQYSTTILITDMTDIFNSKQAHMGFLVALKPDFKGSPFAYNRALPIPTTYGQFQLIPSRYQQLSLEQKQYLSEKTQSPRHSIGHPSTEA